MANPTIDIRSTDATPAGAAPRARPAAPAGGAADGGAGKAPNLDTILRIPVTMQVVLGRAQMPVANLMKLARGSVVPLDHRVGEVVDVVVNGRLIARGEVVILEEDSTRFGVSLTEIAGPNGLAAAE
jgi:flagellar motor switch protein FliN/FliY